MLSLLNNFKFSVGYPNRETFTITKSKLLNKETGAKKFKYSLLNNPPY